MKTLFQIYLKLLLLAIVFKQKYFLLFKTSIKTLFIFQLSDLRRSCRNRWSVTSRRARWTSRARSTAMTSQSTGRRTTRASPPPGGATLPSGGGTPTFWGWGNPGGCTQGFTRRWRGASSPPVSSTSQVCFLVKMIIQIFVLN